jgi:hypothetical protein
MSGIVPVIERTSKRIRVRVIAYVRGPNYTEATAVELLGQHCANLALLNWEEQVVNHSRH